MFKYNKDFFLNDSEETFYVAGFLAADGCICNNAIQLTLTIKDREILSKIRDVMEAQHPIRDFDVFLKQTNKSYTSSKLSIGSIKMVKELKDRFNITPNKSKSYQFPKWLLNHKLVHHFLRGIADGDGNWGFYDNRYCFKLEGTVDLLENYLTILNRECQINRYNKTIGFKGGTGHLDFGGNLICGKIAKYLYQNSTIYLQRKYDIAMDSVLHLNNKKMSPTKDQIIFLKKELKTQDAVAKYLGFSTGRISQILNQ